MSLETSLYRLTKCFKRLQCWILPLDLAKGSRNNSLSLRELSFTTALFLICLALPQCAMCQTILVCYAPQYLIFDCYAPQYLIYGSFTPQYLIYGSYTPQYLIYGSYAPQYLIFVPDKFVHRVLIHHSLVLYLLSSVSIPAEIHSYEKFCLFFQVKSIFKTLLILKKGTFYIHQK